MLVGFLTRDYHRVCWGDWSHGLVVGTIIAELLLSIDPLLHVKIVHWRCIADDVCIVLRLLLYLRWLSVRLLRLRRSCWNFRVRMDLDFITLGYRSIMLLIVAIRLRLRLNIDASGNCSGLMWRLPEHGVRLILSIWHEAAIEHLMLMVLLRHGILDVIGKATTSTSTVSIIVTLCPSLVLDQVVIRLMLLSASDLVHDVCVDMWRRMYWLRLWRNWMTNLILRLLGL